MKRSGREAAFVLAVVVMTTGGVARSEMRRAPGQESARATPGTDRAASAAAEVEHVERELIAAIVKVDLVTYDRIVADDYVAYTVSGRESTKAEVMASYRSGTRRYKDLTISNVGVRVFGETAILVATSSGTRIEEGGQPVPNNVRYFRVFTKRAGVWRAVMQFAAPLPPG